MTELIFEVVEDVECGYRANALGYPIHTFGADEQELRSNVQDVVDCYFTGPEGPRPGIVRLHFVRDEVLAW
ncbi:MAG: 2-oxoisovalerate dehydrogenase [bacterium]|nr:2-oxoisovalerate dehydrogenase [bacterium]